MALNIRIPAISGMPETNYVYYGVDSITLLPFDGPMRARSFDIVFVIEEEYDRFVEKFKHDCEHDQIDGEFHIMNFRVRREYKITFFRTSNVA